MHYRKIWEKTNGKIPDGYEIHHIDGNRSNNDIQNLKLVSLQEHLEIHRSQGDHGAVQAILIRMDEWDRDEISRLASLTQHNLLKSGEHNFQKILPERRSEISRKAALKTVEEKTGIHAINSDPIKARENSRKAGLKSAENKSGFLNTDSVNHGSKHVKGTCWWTHKSGERVRSLRKPDGDWNRGMKYER